MTDLFQQDSLETDKYEENITRLDDERDAYITGETGLRQNIKDLKDALKDTASGEAMNVFEATMENGVIKPYEKVYR